MDSRVVTGGDEVSAERTCAVMQESAEFDVTVAREIWVGSGAAAVAIA